MTRETAKRLADRLGVDKIQVIHHVLHALAVKLLPQYEADDGPLTTTHIRQIKKCVPLKQQAFYSFRPVRGCDSKLTKQYGGEFTLSRGGNLTAYDMTGLSYDTMFDLKRAVDLPCTSERFAVPPAAPHGQTPKLGTLHPSLMLAPQAAYRAATE